MYDPEAQSWSSLCGAMATERKYCAAATLGGRIYVVGGLTERRHRLAEVEAYDPREGAWRRVAAMAVPRSSCGAAVLQERLYVVGGSAGEHVFHDTVECYVPAAGKFMRLAPTGVARSSFALAAL